MSIDRKAELIKNTATVLSSKELWPAALRLKNRGGARRIDVAADQWRSALAEARTFVIGKGITSKLAGLVAKAKAEKDEVGRAGEFLRKMNMLARPAFPRMFVQFNLCDISFGDALDTASPEDGTVGALVIHNEEDKIEIHMCDYCHWALAEQLQPYKEHVREFLPVGMSITIDLDDGYHEAKFAPWAAELFARALGGGRRFDDETKNQMFNEMDKIACGGSIYVAFILAILAEIPCVYGNGKPRSTSASEQHGDTVTVLDVKLPATRYTPEAQLGRMLLRAEQRRRAHEVRGHWRVYRAPSGDEYHRVWIGAHVRGDAALGTVTHNEYRAG